tara:strand:- start:1049 stop:1180 length:132 start_codon:yes stop_codon:yes gene_type:complete
MGEYFSFSPWGVGTGGGGARIILGEVEVLVGGAVNGGFGCSRR